MIVAWIVCVLIALALIFAIISTLDAGDEQERDDWAELRCLVGRERENTLYRQDARA